MATEEIKDVEMKDVEVKGDEIDPKKAQLDKDQLTFEGLSPISTHHATTFKCILDIREQMRLVERGVNQKEPRFINRAVRSLQSLRKRVSDGILRKLIIAYYPPSKF